MPKLMDRFKNGWNAFLGRDPTFRFPYGGSSIRPDRIRLSRANARSIINSIYNRLSVDVASMNVYHVRLDEEGNYKETIDSDLNDALSWSANLDQTGRQLIQDAAMSMFDEGCVAIFPVEVDTDPNNTDAYKIGSIRTAKVVEWYPTSVRLEAYDERDGQKKEIVLDKSIVAIIENPFYSIMNEPNSTLQRLTRILNQLDRTNEQNSSGKMDLIIQLPYIIRSKAREIQAKRRQKELERQLSDSTYGIGYIDGTERVIQLNRSVENNLWNQAKELTIDLYNQLGLTQSILDGTADETTLNNYFDRTITPVITAIVEEMRRKWISKTARTQGQTIMFFRDPFKLLPVSQVAEMGDKLTRNEIMTSNEVRAKIGLKPSQDPRANELRNSNINHPEDSKGDPVNIDISEIENKKVS